MQQGPYRVDSLLHREEGSETYLVQREADGTWWALKVLTDTDRRHVERLEREALVRDGLRHPHIVPAYDVLTIAGHAAMVMDFVEGPSLKEWLVTHAPTPSEAIQLFAGIVQAVSHAHDHDVVHRDLRPGTILLAPAGAGAFTPRVADWGLAKIREQDIGVFGGLTTVQHGLGAAGYAAPEQVRDASTASPAADVFSLGCILYELLIGQGPFHGRTMLDAAMAARAGDYPHIRRETTGLVPELVILIDEMLSPNPEARPANGHEVWLRLAQLPAVPITDESRPWWFWVTAAAAPLAIAWLVGLVVNAAL